MNLDVANLFLFCLISVVIGAIIMLIVQYYVFLRYFKMNSDEVETEPPEQTNGEVKSNEKFILPEALMECLKKAETDKSNGLSSVNLTLQFLFFELRYSNQVRKWFDRKLSMELDELLSKTTIGKFFSKLSIRDLDLGNQFPEIKSLRVASAELHKTEGHIENLDILMDLQYKGNFQISIDADMVLGKKGFLSLKVKQLSGLARLQFTRNPFTHWSLSFVNEPVVEIAVESQIQGRQMQSNVTSLISNQVKKAIRRKHTLPNYKLRFKPFFTCLQYDDIDLPLLGSGTLEVTLRDLTRLNVPTHVTHIYSTLTMSAYPWVTAKQHDDKNLTITMDIQIHRAKNQQIGIVFQVSEDVVIESIIPNTPAAKAKLKRNDILLSIEGKKLKNINQVAKVFKSLNKLAFTMRVERIVPGIIKNDAILEDFADVYEDFNTVGFTNISFSKDSESVHFTEPTTRTTATKEKPQTSQSSSESSTPSHSPRRILNKTKNLIRNNSDSKSVHPSDATSITNTSMQYHSNEFHHDFSQHSTVDCSVSNFIRMNDSTIFNLDSNYAFLNVNVYGRSIKNDNVLLGYLNIPIDNVLAECNDTTMYNEKYFLKPPEIPELSNHQLSGHSGFSSTMCYGDVRLAFVWSPEMLKGSQVEKLINEEAPKPKLTSENSQDKGDGEYIANKQHDFVRMHFHSSTHCDFCGKKIWLKDALQCRDCSFSCHKKCISRCQNSTVCSGTENTSPSAGVSQTSLLEDSNAVNNQPEFRVTSANGDEDSNDLEIAEEILDTYKLTTGHRQSFSDLLAQGIKRVNSANNLVIPNIVSSLTQSSKSLPPTPQHTPRKQSLIAQNINPFIIVVQRLDQLSLERKELSCDEIRHLTEPLVSWGSLDDLMELAKSSSEFLYIEFDLEDRVSKINVLLAKLRIALDSETSFQQKNKSKKLTKQDSGAKLEVASKTFVNGQSEERIQVLSCIMLHLCSGLQSAVN